MQCLRSTGLFLLHCSREPSSSDAITRSNRSNFAARIISFGQKPPSGWYSLMASPEREVRGIGKITHIIFDMDGLLLDTENFYSEVQETILARYNKSFDWSLKARMMGMKAIEAARVFVQETEIDEYLSAEGFLLEREDMLEKMFPKTELMPGASRLIRHLHHHGVPICIATGLAVFLEVTTSLETIWRSLEEIRTLGSSPEFVDVSISHRRHFELKTERHMELFSLMHHVVLGDDPEVKYGKPSPDIFLVAARRFEINSAELGNVLVFEDAPSGVLAAKNAGMSVVMVPDPRLDVSHHANADQVLSSLLDLDPEYWGLPAFKEEAQ